MVAPEIVNNEYVFNSMDFTVKVKCVDPILMIQKWKVERLK